jgi:S-DNA-T family DNA segregation ATPase FtsK/SpoIIIE
MSKRGRKKKIKFDVKPETLKAVLALAILLLGMLILWSLISPEYKLTSFIFSSFKKLLGFGMYLLPITLVYTGAILLWRFNNRFINIRIVVGLYLLIFLVSSQSSVFSPSFGGLLGQSVSNFLISNIGNIGASIVLIFSIFGVLIFITNTPLTSIQNFLEVFGSKFSSLQRSKTGTIQNDGNIVPESFQDLEPFAKIQKETPLDSTYEFVTPPVEPYEPEIKKPSISSKSAKSNKTASIPVSNKVWEYPPVTLLDEADATPIDRGDVKNRSVIIKETLAHFGIPVEVKDIIYGPTVTLYAIEPASGVPVANILNKEKNLALALASPSGSVRIQAPIPGKNLIGIEVPNTTRAKVNIRTILSSDEMKKNKNKLAVALGVDVGGKPVITNISTMPHLLVAGSTGQGKSVLIQAILFSILFRNSPSECKLVVFDPKRVDFTPYNDIPHLIAPIVTDPTKGLNAFSWAVTEMEKRYELLSKAVCVNIEQYNEKSGFVALPNIVFVVDELADLMMNENVSRDTLNKIGQKLQRLLQLGRAAGIHLILATQRPSTDVITGTMKANIPYRIALKVTSNTDSRVILDRPGAENLLGKGDMILLENSNLHRIQAPMVASSEIDRLTGFLKNQGVTPEYNEEILNPKTNVSVTGRNLDAKDNMYEEAKELVIQYGKASATFLQQKLSIGYPKAAKIIDELEASGVIGPASGGSKSREVLIKNDFKNESLPNIDRFNGLNNSDLGNIGSPQEDVPDFQNS